MKLFKRPVVWLVVIIIYSCLTLLLSSFSVPTLIKKSLFDISGSDLFLHAIEYGLLAWIVLRYLSVSGRLSRSRLVWWLPVIFSTIIGCVNELYQGSVPGRSPSISDFVANMVGAVIVVLWTRRRLKHKNLTID